MDNRRRSNQDRRYDDARRDEYPRRDERNYVGRNDYRNEREVEGHLRFRSELKDNRYDRRDGYDDRRSDYRFNDDNERFGGRRNDSDGRESYASTLRNYHPTGGRRIEASKPEDLEWQSNAPFRSDRREGDYNHESRNYNRQDDYRWNRNQPENYSRFNREDRGYRGDYDNDFFWQT